MKGYSWFSLPEYGHHSSCTRYRKIPSALNGYPVRIGVSNICSTFSGLYRIPAADYRWGVTELLELATGIELGILIFKVVGKPFDRPRRLKNHDIVAGQVACPNRIPALNPPPAGGRL